MPQDADSRSNDKYSPQTEKPKRPSKNQLFETLIQGLKAIHVYARDDASRLHIYANGKYSCSDPQYFRKIVQEIMQSHGMDKIFEDEFLHKAQNHLIGCSRPLWSSPPTTRVCLRNGIYDLLTEEFLPHSEDWLSTVQLDIMYDPSASCPEWLRYLPQISKPQDVDFHLQFISSCMTPGSRLRQGIWIDGPAKSGKSTYALAIVDVLSPENCLTFSIGDFDSDKFHLPTFDHKLFCVDLDAKDQEISNGHTIKKLISGDPLMARHIRGEPFQMRFFGKLALCANKMPNFKEKSTGITSRFLVVPAYNIISQESPEWKAQDYLLSLLSSPSEHSGLFNLLAKAWQKVYLQGHYDVPTSVLDHTKKFQSSHSQLKIFLDSQCLVHNDGWCFRETFIQRVNEWLTQNGHPIMTPQAIGIDLKHLVPGSGESNAQKTNSEGKSKRIYLGIDLI